MKIFIIGASGLVGSHCLSFFKSIGWEVLGTHLNFPTDDTEKFNFSSDDVEQFLKDFNFIPDAIVHCAALTNVDYCEHNIEESYSKTVFPTKKIVEYCQRNQTYLAYISTDYVFDGLKGPYTEEAPVNPLNIYGKHKLECEKEVSKLSNHLILRITNVYGEEERSKNFISRLVSDLQNGVQKSLNLPYDQFATPIYAGDIAKMIQRLIEDRKYGIYHLSGSDYYNRYQLAKKILSYFNDYKGLILNPIRTRNSDQVALRPLNGGLLNIKFINEYPEFTFENVDSFLLKVLKDEV